MHICIWNHTELAVMGHMHMYVIGNDLHLFHDIHVNDMQVQYFLSHFSLKVF